jgi:rare lipoprotein A
LSLLAFEIQKNCRTLAQGHDMGAIVPELSGTGILGIIQRRAVVLNNKSIKRIRPILVCLTALLTACSYYAPPLPRGKIARVEYGLGSFYGEEFKGRKTASGEIFNPLELTAAHRTLPFGTLVRVTSPGTRKYVTVRINDRGPFKKGRIIDLSYEAARRLGVVGEGIFKVRIEILK